MRLGTHQLITWGFCVSYLAVMGCMIVLVMPLFEPYEHMAWPILAVLALIGCGLVGMGKWKQSRRANYGKSN